MSTRDLVPVTADARAAEPVPGLAAALAGTGPALLVLPAGPEGARLRASLLAPGPLPADTVPADTAVVLATSGSTGEPKGVRLGAAELAWSAAATHEFLGGPGQWLLAMSPARVGGLQVLVRSQLAGTPPVALDPSARFTPEAFAAATAALAPGVRHYTALVPTQLHRLLEAGVALDAFDAVLLGGAAIPTALLLRARAAGTRVVRTYGMTETAGGCVYDGRPLPGVTVEVVDPVRTEQGSLTPCQGQGLVRLAGPMLARGYLGADQGGFGTGPAAHGRGFAAGPAAPRRGLAAGPTQRWFLTSDVGRLDGTATGRVTLHVIGRADDVIVTGGSNVAAQSVEASLAEHPAVAAVAVAGRPDEEWGEVVVAVVVPAAGARLDPRELRAYVGEALGWPYAPREVLTADALPLLSSGKLDRAAVRALVRAASPAPG